MTFAAATNGPGLPDMTVSVRQVFGIDTNLEVPAYSRADEHVPDVDPDYLFNREVTLAILAGFKHNRRVMIQGYHGTGKSTHIEQVAARLNWPCMRINLDSHVSRIDLSGKLTLLDQSKVIRPNPAFRLFATTNTIGLGDTSGLYHGTQQINQGQMDR